MSTTTLSTNYKSKTIVLKSLSVFLTNALSLPNRTSINPTVNPSELSPPTWYLTSSFMSREGYETFDNLFQPLVNASRSSRRWQPEVEPETSDEDFIHVSDFHSSTLTNRWTVQELSEVVNQTGTLAEKGVAHSVDISFVVVCSRNIFMQVIPLTSFDCSIWLERYTRLWYLPSLTARQWCSHLLQTLLEVNFSWLWL